MGWSLFITVGSVVVIVFLTAMTAYYITRIKTWWTSMIYYAFAFSMIAPFQMVMFPTVKVADQLGLATPWGMIVLYLGFGGGLSVFLFAGFIKSIPMEIEEAAYMDGCSPLQTYFKVVMPLLKPTAVTVAILNAMWVWNDFLLPNLVIGQDERYKTVPIVIQSLVGSNGNRDMGAQMAMLVFAIVPIVAFYLFGQKQRNKRDSSGRSEKLSEPLKQPEYHYQYRSGYHCQRQAEIKMPHKLKHRPHERTDRQQKHRQHGTIAKTGLSVYKLHKRNYQRRNYYINVCRVISDSSYRQ